MVVSLRSFVHSSWSPKQLVLQIPTAVAWMNAAWFEVHYSSRFERVHLMITVQKTRCIRTIPTQLMIRRWPSQNTFGMWTMLYWTQPLRTQFSMSINVWRLVEDNLNITCNFLYCKHQVHRELVIILYYLYWCLSMWMETVLRWFVVAVKDTYYMCQMWSCLPKFAHSLHWAVLMKETLMRCFVNGLHETTPVARFMIYLALPAFMQHSACP
jgi:hypothetical protein